MTTTYISLTISALIITAALPAVLWYRRTGSYKQILYGIFGFAAFAAIIEKIVFLFLLGWENPLAIYVNSSPVALLAAGCSMAGLFEEWGRHYVFTKVMGDYTDKGSAIGYGIGHGSIEVLLNAVYPLLLTAPAVFTAQDMGICVTERIVAMCGHIALSIIVFYGVRTRRSPVVLPLAMLLHAVADVPIGMIKYGFWTRAVGEPVFAAFVTVLCLMAFYCWRYMSVGAKIDTQMRENCKEGTGDEK